jgi:hypothetical protein
MLNTGRVLLHPSSAQKSKALTFWGKRFPNHQSHDQFASFDDVTQNIRPDSVRHCPKVQAASNNIQELTLMARKN